MIDLHLHTTASDGRCTPEELAERAARAGLTMAAVTDHDTTAGIEDFSRFARSRGIDTVTGIEITAVEDGRDVHVLGYFFDPADRVLDSFLAVQRGARVDRLREIGARLEALGMPIDVAPLLGKTMSGASVGRPLVARALIEAGYVADTREAFDRWLATDRPAFVPRVGPSIHAVIAVLHDAGGIASLAHPGKAGFTRERIAPLADAGLDALEAFHPDHDAILVDRYIQIARDCNLLLTGGSDFHDDPAHGWEPGAVTLPADAFERLREASEHGRR